MRLPSIRTTVASQRTGSSDRAVRIERRQLHRLTRLGDVAELLHHQAADGLVFAFGSTESGVLGHLVDAQQPRHAPAVAAHPQHVGCDVVVLVADVADDLLDQVFHRHHACGAAVFVGHQHGLQRARPDLRHHVVPVERRRHHGDGQWPGPQARSAADRPGGTSKTCLTWTSPIVSSRSPSTIGKRE